MSTKEGASRDFEGDDCSETLVIGRHFLLVQWHEKERIRISLGQKCIMPPHVNIHFGNVVEVDRFCLPISTHDH